MKGIILAGGSGTRLYPATLSIGKQLLPIYDNPMIYYPLSTLMLAGIREVLIISTLRDTPLIKELLGDGRKLGVEIRYRIQNKPRGLPEAFVLGKDFIGKDPVTLILGDNLFHGNLLSKMLFNAKESPTAATVFTYYVSDPRSFGIAELDSHNNIVGIEEKPAIPKTNRAVVGLYIYDNEVISISENLKPSSRGELEITEVNNTYLRNNSLNACSIDESCTWFDVGTLDSMIDAIDYVRAFESNSRFKIACIEETAWRMHYINDDQLHILGSDLEKSPYGKYILGLLD